MALSLSPLRRLPLEIILRITDDLSTVDLGHVRLTCRGLAEAVERGFIEEFFVRKQFMMSDFSLRALVDIAHSRLGQHLRTLYIGLNYLDTVARKPDDRVAKQIYDQYMARHPVNWSVGLFRDLLTEAFAHLPNLEAIVFRSFNSKTRYREGPNAEWRSYGMPTANAAADAKLFCLANWSAGWYRGPPGDRRSGVLARAWPCVIQSLRNARARPKVLEMLVRDKEALPWMSFDLPDDAATDRVLRNLQRLHLHIQGHRDGDDIFPHDSDDQENAAYRYQFVMRLLTRCTNLKALRLNISPRNQAEDVSVLLRWLRGVKPTAESTDHDGEEELDNLPHPPPLCHLQSLSFGHMEVDPDELLHVISHFAPQLKRLELWRLLVPTRRLTQGDPFGWHWLRFFQKLQRVPDLHPLDIMAGALSEPVPGEISVTLRDVLHDMGKDPSLLRYRGQHWKDWANKVIVCLKKRPVTFSPHSFVEDSLIMEPESEDSLSSE